MSARWVMVAFVSVCLLLALSKCGGVIGPPDADTTLLAADRAALTAKLRECRRQVVPLADPSCQVASEIWRRRFLLGTTEATATGVEQPRLSTPAGVGQGVGTSRPWEHGL